MAGLFGKIKKDVKKGIDEGIAVFKEGANVVSEKVGELTAEGKRQYKIYDLKAKIHGQMTVLGGRVYEVLDGKKSPAADNGVKAAFVKIKKMEAQLQRLEGVMENKAASKKTAKPAVKKAAPKAAKKAPAKKKA